MKNKKEEGRPLGKLTSMNLFIESPIKMNFLDLGLKELNILVGMNGTGKTFVMVCAWVMNYIMHTLVAKRNAGDNSITDDNIGQFVIQYSLSPSLTGVIKARFESGSTLDVSVKDGKVLSVVPNMSDDIDQSAMPVYMSSNFRTFSSMCTYLSVRKACGKTAHTEIIQEMVNHFKLYDVMNMERLILRMPIKIDPAAMTALRDTGFGDNIKSIDVDLDKCEFTAELHSTGVRRVIDRWYGSGHQALLNMFVNTQR